MAPAQVPARSLSAACFASADAAAVARVFADAINNDGSLPSYVAVAVGDSVVVVDRAAPGWRGFVGVVTSLIPRAPFDPHNAVAFVCGPEIMMKYTVDELERRGVTSDHVYLSMERNMKCGIGFCGHCPMGPAFVCKDGPVFAYPDIEKLMRIRGI